MDQIEFHNQRVKGNWEFLGKVDFKGLTSFSNAVGVFNETGDNYFLDPADGDDGYSGKSPSTAKKTLTAAEELLVTNQNDKLHFLGGNGSISLSANLAWDKNYTHLIGHCAHNRVGQRARIFQDADTTGMAPLITISGTGCYFSNFSVFQGVADATSLGAVELSGARCRFEGVRIAGIGNNSQDVNGSYSIKLNGAEECDFIDCAIGLDTIAAGSAATSQDILIDGGSKRLWFENCLIYRWIEHASNYVPVTFADTSSYDRWLMFNHCTFHFDSTNHVHNLAEVFNIPAAHQTMTIVLHKSPCFGKVAAWDADGRGHIELMDTVTPANSTDGLALTV